MEGNKWSKIIVIIIASLLVLMILIGLIVGVASLKAFFKWLIGGVLGLGILFGLMYVFYLIFIKKEFKDIPALYKKKLGSTARLMKNDMLGDLYLSGDSKHNRIKLGKYRPLRIQLPKQTRKEVKVKQVGEKPHVQHMIDNPFRDKDSTKIQEYTEAVEVDLFVVYRQGMMDKMFSQPLFIMCKPEDHNYSSIFHDVTLNGFNLVPIDNQFHTLNTRNLDIDITKGVAMNYIRETVYEILGDLDRLVKQAMNLDQRYQKEKEKGMEFSVPQLPFGGGSQGGSK